MVHKRVPELLMDASWMLPKWPRKCLTNSIPLSSFFQNLMWPSQLNVIMNPVLMWFKVLLRNFWYLTTYVYYTLKWQHGWGYLGACSSFHTFQRWVSYPDKVLRILGLKQKYRHEQPVFTGVEGNNGRTVSLFTFPLFSFWRIRLDWHRPDEFIIGIFSIFFFAKLAFLRVGHFYLKDIFLCRVRKQLTIVARGRG